MKPALVLAAVLCLTFAASAQSAIESSLVGIRPGKDSDDIVVSRLGPGFDNPGEGPGGARYYTTPSRDVTLIVSRDGQGIVIMAELIEGLIRPQTRRNLMRPGGNPRFFLDPPRQAVVNLKPLSTGSGVRLGMSTETVHRYYGDPTEERDTGGLHWLTYKTDYAHDYSVLLYQAAFGFKGGRLTRIMIFSGQ